MSEFYVVSFAHLSLNKIKHSQVYVIGVYNNLEKATKVKDEVYKFLDFARDYDYDAYYYDCGTVTIQKCTLNVENNNYRNYYKIDEEYKEFLNKQYKNE